MFYTAELENVYYSEKSDCFIVADIENNNVYLHSVLYKNYIPLFLKTYTLFLTKPLMADLFYLVMYMTAKTILCLLHLS